MHPKESQQAKVLHCVERMHTNAIESWLARMLRHGIRMGQSPDWYFHVQSECPGALETQYPELKGRILRSKWPFTRWGKFFWAFQTTCKSGNFDVVHIHADLMSAPYIWAARLARIPRTIVHVHNADENIPVASSTKAAILRLLFRAFCVLFADRIVGISRHTLNTFLRGYKVRPRRDRVHYYGVDSSPFFELKVDREHFRRSLGLKENSTLLLFAGRMVPEKNPLHALRTLNYLCKLNPNVAGVFVGSGSLKEPLIALAHELGVTEKFRFLGWRSDLPEIMGCCEWFVLPHPEHPMEGLGLAVIEAQLAGMRLLLSTGIADDPILPGACFTRLSVTRGPEAWAAAAVELLNKPAPSRTAAAAALAESPFDMDFALNDLLALYR